MGQGGTRCPPLLTPPSMDCIRSTSGAARVCMGYVSGSGSWKLPLWRLCILPRCSISSGCWCCGWAGGAMRLLTAVAVQGASRRRSEARYCTSRAVSAYFWRCCWCCSTIQGRSCLRTCTHTCLRTCRSDLMDPEMEWAPECNGMFLGAGSPYRLVPSTDGASDNKARR